MKTWSNHSATIALALIPLACLISACHTKPHVAAQSEWQILKPGDYMREEYIQAVTETRSPLKSWQEIEAKKNASVEIITIENDKDGPFLTVDYNFHEGSEPFRPAADGVVTLDNSLYSLRVLDRDRFVLSSRSSSMRFQYVGDWQKWSNEATIAGSYQDEEGQRYIFKSNGEAQFPGNETFDYNVGLDMILCSYDYIYSNKLKKTRAINVKSNTLKVFDVDLSGDAPEGVVSPLPRWTLKKLTPEPPAS
jgi:hypothetical protein